MSPGPGLAAGARTPGATPARARAQAQRTPARGSRGPRGDADGAPGGDGGALWVNKHAPRSFMSLLSDEAVNREVVKWVKSWDACVFGKEARPQAEGAARAAGAGNGLLGAGGGMSRAAAAVLRAKQKAAEGDNRPEHKAILICGPPGACCCCCCSWFPSE